MDLQTVESLLDKFNGRFTIMYPILKNRLSVYSEYEVPFPQEFLFFEERYLTIKKHMIENDIRKDVVDIGCQFGFQSEIFLDCDNYLGIDVEELRFFNTDKENVNYKVGLFPYVDINLTNKTVISSMSLGYFDLWIDKDEMKAKEKIVDKLKESETLYIATKKELVDMLSDYFDNTEVLRESKAGDFHLYVLWRGE